MKKILTVLSIASISYLSAVELTLDKPDYTTTDTIKINFSEMDNHHKDWIAIYPKGSSTAWKNVVKWAWTYNKSEGTFTFKNLPAGEYEARAFFNNSYYIEASEDFWVNPSNHPGTKAELTTTKPTFTTTEDVRINFKNINGATNDWLAIYPAYKDNSWGNVVKWKFNKGGVKEGQANFDKLPTGKYEARVFYNNTFKMEGRVAFEVREMVVPIDNKILKLAKEHCLGKNENSDKVLCTNYKNIVYVIKSEPRLWQTINTIYKVDITPNKEKIDTLKPYIQENRAGLCFNNDTHIFKNSSLFKVIDNTVIEESSGVVVILNDKGKKILSARYTEHSSIFPRFETTDNGNKLIVISGDNPYYITPGIQTTAIYDISNPNEAVLLSKKERIVK